jgi:pyruvate dehydrogenase E1 component
MLQVLTRDKKIGSRIVPIVPDEARTFGMEGMFRQLGIYSCVGQRYNPEDADQLAFYKEDIKGQILEEGITEAGSMSSWIAAATSYANHGVALIPFYIFYSMFGFQRVADLCWAAGDMRARGFLLGGTAGRTTLNGEGLQHEDGHSHVFSSVIPNCVSYDPAFAYEVVTIVHDGMRRMYTEQQDIYYYLTLYNENNTHPAMPEGAAEGIIKGLYPLSKAEKPAEAHVQLLGCGSIMREVIAAAEMLRSDWGVTADVWSAPSFTELARDGQEVERWNLLHPEQPGRKPYVTRCLEGCKGPAIVATDYVKAFAEQVRAWVPMAYHVLGTDGFGRSDTRENLRHFFEVDRRWVTVRALKALADEGKVPVVKVTEAMARYGIDAAKPDPVKV